MTTKKDHYQINPIGYVRASDATQQYILEIGEAYRPALLKMDEFSHIMIFWWAHQMDTEEHRKMLRTDLPYADGVEAGVFACRSEYRPNPIAVTTMPILDVDEENGIVVLPWIDAFDGSPIIDIKPYMPVSDRIRDCGVASWLADWPLWMEDGAAFFAEHATDFGD